MRINYMQLIVILSKKCKLYCVYIYIEREKYKVLFISY